MVIVYLLALVSTTIACTRVPSSAKDAFCAADLVSKIKVISFHEQANNSYTSDSAYYVRHRLVYKKPHDYDTSPSAHIVYTPSDSSCGLRMEVGKDYLLTGYRCVGNMHVYRCHQVNDRYLSGAIEWSTVSEELRESLKTFQC
ncbi:TIMP metallopeptidase inhibitor 2 [Parelaphostrongylus tenuis]|uniref:TIMP metallopeptidase inhibitor 2 n=1 Tax=Parelaphostrongylus tenuis TaxID=148309 RepID=A0AAD5R3I2_PARTN|nr:TIMP metallopeptidase inhibitor 2 [Parelaphostrongylus tenuis]